LSKRKRFKTQTNAERGIVYGKTRKEWKRLAALNVKTEADLEKERMIEANKATLEFCARIRP
jgi:hypothetical protein